MYLLTGLAAVASSLGILILNTLSGLAQSEVKPASAPAFEVASIKPASPKAQEVGFDTLPGGRLIVRNAALWQIIQEAFELRPRQLQGATGPSFVARYDIDAEAEGDPTRGQMMAMLRTLLCDRFQLKFHRETKVVPIYELIIAKHGPKLKGSAATEPGVRLHRIPSTNGSGMGYVLTAQKISMSKFSGYYLTSMLERSVFDRTGIKGEFDFQMNYAHEDNPDAPSLFTAIQTQLGLKLRPSKGPVETFIVDHAERPSEN